MSPDGDEHQLAHSTNLRCVPFLLSQFSSPLYGLRPTPKIRRSAKVLHRPQSPHTSPIYRKREGGSCLQSCSACSSYINGCQYVDRSFQCCDLVGFNVIVPGPVIHRVILPVEFLLHGDVCGTEILAILAVVCMEQQTTDRTLVQRGVRCSDLLGPLFCSTHRCPVRTVHPCSVGLECLKSSIHLFGMSQLDFFICRIFQRRVMYFSLIHQ